ncbi:MAG: DNA-methyltransferase [Candidatus Kariarchaeaceae archaeon]|jgi:DNA modification methylase
MAQKLNLPRPRILRNKTLVTENHQENTFKTHHEIYFKNSSNMKEVLDASIQLVCTSPPYCMIEMWDQIFSNMNPDIQTALENENGHEAFELMHRELDKVWREVDRVVAQNGFVCINIGDATRKIGGEFQLFPNHSRITNFFIAMGYQALPSVIWSKQTNKPTKFMGSGMYPSGAYVTLEHEYILIFRKGGKRKFSSDHKKLRKESSYFWEERNKWFSDLWYDLKGISQKTQDKEIRRRSAAYPFELPYRLINMYSVREIDTVLDPFLGTGTTTMASLLLGRNSIGYEIDPNFRKILLEKLDNHKLVELSHSSVEKRINLHRNFQVSRESSEKQMKYHSEFYNFKTISKQEQEIKFPLLRNTSVRYSITDITLQGDYDFNIPSI